MKTCVYCKKKTTTHLTGCPELYSPSTKELAISIYERGFLAGRTGQPRAETDITYCVGHRIGKIEFNDGRD